MSTISEVEIASVGVQGFLQNALSIDHLDVNV